MRNKFNILVAATLMTSAAFAQENQEFETIANQLTATEQVSVDALVEASRQQFLNAQFVQAQKGFEQAVKIDPENKTAKMYLRALLERNTSPERKTALEEVDAAWCTAISMRSYALAEEALDKMGLADVEEPTNVVGLFPQADFGKGASAIYQPDMGAIFVRNTAENFEVIEVVLDALEVLKDSDPSDQVEIEAKFVEVSEGALEELGFQWNIDGTIGSGDYEFQDGTGLFDDSLRTSPYETTPNGDGRTGASGDWSSFRMSDAFSSTPATMSLQSTGNTPIELLISALDQNNGADVLSAPRITTKSGEEATIVVGERHYFPEVYEVDTSEGAASVVSYQDFEEQTLGVELSVTPEVEDENITLALNPKISEIVGWQQYLVLPQADPNDAASGSMYNHRQASKLQPIRLDEDMVAQLPILKRREIETEVTIADGSTLAMGGLISEKVEAFEDKVPVLGDVPFVGRLFRNEGERSVKRNLLMFVTAKVVEPSGHVKTARSFE